MEIYRGKSIFLTWMTLILLFKKILIYFFFYFFNYILSGIAVNNSRTCKIVLIILFS